MFCPRLKRQLSSPETEISANYTARKIEPSSARPFHVTQMYNLLVAVFSSYWLEIALAGHLLGVTLLMGLNLAKNQLFTLPIMFYWLDKATWTCWQLWWAHQPNDIVTRLQPLLQYRAGHLLLGGGVLSRISCSFLGPLSHLNFKLPYDDHFLGFLTSPMCFARRVPSSLQPLCCGLCRESEAVSSNMRVAALWWSHVPPLTRRLSPCCVVSPSTWLHHRIVAILSGVTALLSLENRGGSSWLCSW